MHERTSRPGPGQESVWEYPRPPLVQSTDRHIQIVFGGQVVADTRRALRVLETGHAPAYYVPFDDIRPGVLEKSARSSYCDFKGEARYHHVRASNRHAPEAAWSYESPTPGYEVLAGHVAFRPAAMDQCLVDDEEARPQPGQYSVGWITADVIGPFCGESRAAGR